MEQSNADALFVLLEVFCAGNHRPNFAACIGKDACAHLPFTRSDVLNALKDPNSNLSSLVKDWRALFVPRDQMTLRLPMPTPKPSRTPYCRAYLTGEATITVPGAVQQIRAHHAFLSDVLKVLGDERAQQGIEIPIQLLERLIAAVDPVALRKKGEGDPWLYFYENFLAEYDPKLRNDRGVYYTPIGVVQVQVRLVAELLETKFDLHFSFANEKVITLDPAAGTAMYLLAALERALDEVEKCVVGRGMRQSAATHAAKNMHGFEIMVGPYTVAHLRLAQAFDLKARLSPMREFKFTSRTHSNRPTPRRSNHPLCTKAGNANTIATAGSKRKRLLWFALAPAL